MYCSRFSFSLLENSPTLPKLFQRKLRIAKKVLLLNKHIPMLEKLALESMSTDESDDDEGLVGDENTATSVVSPRWRAHHLTQWLRVFDSVHCASGMSQGSPRFCIFNNSRISQSTKFVANLPINAYDQRWLQRRNDVNFAVFLSTNQYDFTHDSDVFE
jgi:hypothetical protein